ncbi:SOS response-associated peptidase [Phycisphaera mikurensis]|uniref:Abasic site processing protein n=1 Tax=Phycisphaera mikurensis (strain NBRC 102666 / KCTC 22515 / FYK2301M01) TaxID=1142394 RepID=I0IFP6_PHYMF|nr:SOS response-associated peptidase [Phycisphaera mikurensis]MBB6440526.1 putative SOS response-associated peptidase YedK [Phycisphaera mikurensis]BAM04084.1 hypothetical protein PSMK_19250 [Phycisphaera mikurensis NBRC 102666]
MCGRVQIKMTSREAAEAFGADARCDAAVFERWNAAPSQRLPLLQPAASGGLELAAADWGFSKPGGGGPRPINARSETAPRSGFFSAAWRRGRAALPVTGFFEWQAPQADAAPPLFGGDASAARKTPWLIERADGRPFALAALRNEAGFCVLTTAPNAAVARIHDRMPVVLDRAALERWLDPRAEPDALRPLMRPCPAEDLRFTRVADAVNAPANEGPAAAEPRAEPVAGATFAAPAA